MRPIPNIDAAAMADRGRHSALMSARNEACDALRNVFVSVQSADMGSLADKAKELHSIAERLAAITALWAQIKADKYGQDAA